MVAADCLVSIIIPVHNSQVYLKECIDSVVSQTLKHVEIICVDDGSTDDSLNILKEYRENHANFIILHTGGEGAAVARNKGLEYAQGKYVIFLDSDDIFEKDMLEELYTSAMAYDADISLCEYDTELIKSDDKYLEIVMQKYLGQYSEQSFQLEELPIEGLTFWATVAWNKMFKREFLLETGITFQNLKNSNDLYFVDMSMILAGSIIHAKSFKPMIHHRTNIAGQISSQRNIFNLYNAYVKIYDGLTKAGVSNKIFKQYYVDVFWHVMASFYNVKSEQQKENFYDFFSKYGMENIGLKNGVDYDGLGAYKEFVDLFQSLPYESQWYKKGSLIGFQLRQRGLEEVINLCCKVNAAVWGAAGRGATVANIFQKNNVQIMGLIDKDITKQGNTICGYKIYSFRELDDKVDMIIITSKQNFGSICRSIYESGRKQIKVLPLFMYVESQLKIEDCIFAVGELKEHFTITAK